MIAKVLSFVITASGLVGCLTFVIRYWWRTRGGFWHNEVGRFFVVVYVNLAALFLLVIINLVFPSWPGRNLAGFILYATFAIESWWPLRLLFVADELEHERSRRLSDD